MIWLRIVGTALQLAGLMLAARGVADRRKAHAPDQRGIWGSVVHVLRIRWHWFRRVILRRRGVTVTGRMQAVLSALEANIAGRVMVGWGDLPAESTPDERIAALDVRTQRLRKDLNDLEGKLLDHQGTTKAGAERLRADVDKLSAESRAHLAAAMADGLDREAAGLALAAFGTALAAFG